MNKFLSVIVLFLFGVNILNAQVQENNVESKQ